MHEPVLDLGWIYLMLHCLLFRNKLRVFKVLGIYTVHNVVLVGKLLRFLSPIHNARKKLPMGWISNNDMSALYRLDSVEMACFTQFQRRKRNSRRSGWPHFLDCFMHVFYFVIPHSICDGTLQRRQLVAAFAVIAGKITKDVTWTVIETGTSFSMFQLSVQTRPTFFLSKNIHPTASPITLETRYDETQFYKVSALTNNLHSP